MTTRPVPLSLLACRSKEMQAAVACLLQTPRHFAIEQLERLGWVVVPFPDSFTEEQAASLSAAAARRGISNGVAVTTEAEVNEEQFEVAMTLDGVMAFDRNCLLRYFLLVPHGQAFAVLHEANYYWLLAAPPDFAQEVAGKAPKEAFEHFVSSYVNDPGWPASTARMLAEIERYRVLLQPVGA